MAVPAFFDRFADAALPLLGGADRAQLRRWVADLGVTLRAPSAIEDDPAHRAGFLLACNLCARLYPVICVDVPEPVATRARHLLRDINPDVELVDEPRPDDVALSWGMGRPAARVVVVDAHSWTARLDPDDPTVAPCEGPAALAAAAIGCAQVFRAAFAEQLAERARTQPEPGALNVVTQDDRAVDLPSIMEPLDLGAVHLAGCGAIGQACALTLAQLPVQGTLWAVDHERVELSNLQRYVLTRHGDVGAQKTKLVASAMADHPLQVKQLQRRWGTHPSAGPGAQTVLTALDTGADRIDVQGALPRVVYNAYTQPRDLGVSRHERFGTDACLACLYWPTETIPGRHEQIATALNENPLRTLGYLVTKVPIGQPLPGDAIKAADNKALPDDAAVWAERALLDDLAERWELPPAESARWTDGQLEDFYVGAICGGGLATDAATGRDVVVPLAHQSALAGILLAVELLAARHHGLAPHRRTANQGRIDLMRPLPRRTNHQAARTPGCLCSDPDFTSHWNGTWAT